jgi:hypothetical protein
MKRVIGVLIALQTLLAGGALAAKAEPSAAVSGTESRPAAMLGSDRDAQGCIGSAGYSWCARERRCVRSWELAQTRGFPSTEEAFRAYCAVTQSGAVVPGRSTPARPIEGD